MNKKVIVNATALSTSGALTILRQFLDGAKFSSREFICYVPEGVDFNDYKNVKLVKIKKMGWLKRILWDSYILPRIIKRQSITFSDVISLQNTSVNVKERQIIYLHQPIPFSNLNFLKNNSFSFKFFLYKAFYSYFIFRYVKKDTIFIVQTNWMALALQKKNKVKSSNIHVMRPDFVLPEKRKCFFNENAQSNCFKLLYPATPITYKNHLIILKALDIFPIENFKFQVTFNKGQYPKFDKLVNQLGLSEKIEYLGYVDYESLINYYILSDVVLFPSYLETFGMPLLEAASLGKKIICSDLPYAREVLVNYNGVSFVIFNDANDWSRAILNEYHLKVDGVCTPILDIPNEEISNWKKFFDLL
ncbi:glycosyltransferase [Xenorhabdus bovienii]|uniref:glycosyltransferase n=1 Tax=Xenorhabdus bovienii TaxID=40576 RepID=UPI00237CC425|nr:glycosyltransferase [Xenorhabdus bovienii]MDE1482440.1 glycosyltransferase [Xenorhabdus bovienii]MDE9458272.1 glycosyltransferase [Xenorhabdus bovienii]MDE9514338.1 glycosyltransferase [Xenorhabdus bovienii]